MLAQHFSFTFLKTSPDSGHPTDRSDGAESHRVVVETGLRGPDFRDCSLSRSVKFLPSM